MQVLLVTFQTNLLDFRHNDTSTTTVKMYAVHQLFVGQETKPPSDRRAGSRKPKPARCAITPIASRLRFVRWFVLAGRLRLLLVFYTSTELHQHHGCRMVLRRTP